MESRKRKMLSISEKIELIKLMQINKKNKRSIAAKFGIPINTVGTIYAKRGEILGKCKGDFTNMNQKRLRASSYPDIEESLLDWYIKNHNNGHISCPILRVKALQLAKVFGHDNFTASNGWIERFKVRHNLRFKRNKDKSVPFVSVNNDNNKSYTDVSKSVNSLSENPSERDTPNQCETSESQTQETVHNPMEEANTKDNCTTEQSCAVKSKSDSPFVLDKNDAPKTRELCVSPTYLVPDIHLTESLPNNHDFLLSDIFNTDCDESYSNFPIQNVEKAFSVILNYVEHCNENVGEKTLSALKELKSFISKEKQRKTQSKITDFFYYLENQQKSDSC